MSRSNRQKQRISSQDGRTDRRRRFEQPTADDFHNTSLYQLDRSGTFGLIGERVRPKTKAQSLYLNAIDNSTIVFGIGPAGTGKSFAAVSRAIELLSTGEKKKLVITRPAVEAGGEKMGFLPGELQEKFSPYLTPILEILKKKVNPGIADYLIKSGRIEPVPIGYMRGRSFEDTIILVDEAQNLTKEQMKMVLTRIGEGSQLIIDGDPAQSDVKGVSGLIDAVQRIRNVSGVQVIEFDRNDIVRHDIIQQILEQYED